MIPKKIHYCWFGRNPLPKSALKCITSWRRFFPDYEIVEWNEDNFDVNIIPYTSEAYKLKKYAFVSDYARFHILYYHGGLYFDTDVEVIRPMEDIIERGAFMGMEESSFVAPGLGMGAEPKLAIYEEIIQYYSSLHYIDNVGNILPGTVVKHTTDVLVKNGFRISPVLQQVGCVWIYPNDYFNPLEDATGRLNITPNTRSIHWYSKTWCDNYGPIRLWCTRILHRLLGVGFSVKFKRFLHIG